MDHPPDRDEPVSWAPAAFMVGVEPMRPGLLIVLSLVAAGCGKKTASSDAAPPAGSSALPSATASAASLVPAAATTATAAPVARVTPPADMIDADILLDEYRENEVRADAAYKGKLILIRGKVSEVRRSPEGAYVTLTGNATTSVQCFAGPNQESELATLSRGDTVIVAGRVEGMRSALLVRTCAVNPDFKVCRLLTGILGRGDCKAETSGLVVLRVDGADILPFCGTESHYRTMSTSKWPASGRFVGSDSSLCGAPITGPNNTPPGDELVQTVRNALARMIWTMEGPALIP